MGSFEVLIIEDDFRVAEINRQFVEELAEFTVIATCKTGKEAIEFLKTNHRLPDLVLLDVFIPDVKGLELLWTIRTEYKDIDIIMMTAAKEVEFVQEAIRAGIFDYIIKPLDQTRVHESLNRFHKKQKMLTQKREFTQNEIDELRERAAIRPTVNLSDEVDLPKGIDRYTLEKVVTALKEHEEKGISAVEGAKEIGASRSTVRRYLEYLISTGYAHAQINYGDVGRPERRYFPL